ncbi:RtcB family protein [Oricola sp.]|uniref:RtcB family protein n=1 Tax=Oricola sp. TaxID=1979950 RepID=UPI0025E76628|nr:RtcB family protein [Oricola sp.]MCI5075004.1 RtcB family protein [Oricola sp.]
MTGKDLIEAGFQPGKWFAEALDTANAMLAEGTDRDAAFAAVAALAPPPVRALHPVDSKPLHMNIDAENDAEADNLEAVRQSMRALLRTPVVKAGAVMPDACPAGPSGTIPVGGIAVSEAIHPGMHSADICCSMAYTNFGSLDPKALLDATHEATHFGPADRAAPVAMPESLGSALEEDPLLKPHAVLAARHFATQGDGNHFAYVGTLASTGDTILVTHHGSRGLGARLYSTGMRIAERHRLRLAPETLKQNAWIPADTQEGEAYWTALQLVRAWTKANHFAIHDLVAERTGAGVQDRYWNEHNFVFRKSDGLFYHAKGATPAFDGWAGDATDLTIIPLNMAEPLLIVRGADAGHGLGFSPHGAGRNMSRTAHKRQLGDRPHADVFTDETAGIDARFFCGRIDVSELPSAYKNARAVREQIGRFGLAKVVDEVIPHGSIMAGDWEHDAPWRKKRDARSRQAKQ